MSETLLWGVQRAQLADALELCRDLLRDAVRRGGRRTMDELLQELNDGSAQLWVAWKEPRDAVVRQAEAVLVTYIVVSKAAKVCQLWLCSGTDRENWKHHMGTIEAWARHEGCTALEAVARPGWKKVLNGFKLTHVILEKRLV